MDACDMQNTKNACLGPPVVADELYPVAGILMSPMFAGAAMALSSFAVVMNSRYGLPALRLRSCEKNLSRFCAMCLPW